MSDGQASALFKSYPRHFEVPALLVVTFALLVTALSLPFMQLQKFVFWHDDYTLFTSVHGLWSSGHFLLAAIIFCFSVVFPFAKLVGLTLLWFLPTDPEKRDRSLMWISLLGKWSMLDVFVIALLIVLTEAKSFLDATPLVGLYLFAGAIVVSIGTSLWIEYLAKRSTPNG